MFDIYLAGLRSPDWRKEMKDRLSTDISVFDPFVETYEQYTAEEKANQFAKELYYLEECQIVAFYLNPSWEGCSTLLQLGDAVGRNRQTIVCLDGEVSQKEHIRKYCEYRGVEIVENFDDLIVAIEEGIAQLELSRINELQTKSATTRPKCCNNL